MNIRSDLDRRLSTFILQICCILLDTLFLAIWLGLQYLFNNYIKSLFNPVDIELILYQIFQFIFALTTLYPIIFYIYVDISAIYFKSRKQIENIKKHNRNENQ